MGLWDQLRAALSTWWTAWQGPEVDARTQLITWLRNACRTEQRLAAQLRHIAPIVPYEQFRTSLEAMARDDERHAKLLRERLGVVDSLLSLDGTADELAPNSQPGGAWPRLLGVLTEKRELYERYRQGAVVLDEADIQSLLCHLRQEEARHQEQLVMILTHLDAHVHDTIT